MTTAKPSPARRRRSLLALLLLPLFVVVVHGLVWWWMTGMIAAIRRGLVRPEATPVFVHTGGAFGLMARRDLFRDTA